MYFKKLKQHFSYLVVIIALLVVQPEANAQIKKGLFQAGGSVSFFSNNVETSVSNPGNPQTPTTVMNTTNNSASFGPAIGYFVSDNLSLGVQLGFGNIEAENDDFNNTRSTFQYGIYGRWHKPIVERFYFFSSLSFLLGSGNNEVLNTGTGQTEEADISSFNINLAPGLTYFVTDWMSFETSLNLINYAQLKAEADDGSLTQETDNFNLNLNLTNLNIGMVFYF